MSTLTDPTTDGVRTESAVSNESSAIPGEEAVDEAGTDELAALASMLATPERPHADDDDGDSAETVELDLADEREVLSVLPRQRDEFTCPRCFLVMHISRQIGDICRDCS